MLSVSAARRFDPRDWALRWPRTTLLVAAALTLLFVWGNVLARKGGVIDDPILDETNWYQRSDAYVRTQADVGFYPAESVAFILQFPAGIQTPADLERIAAFTTRLTTAFGPAVASLATLTRYTDTGDALRSDPWVPSPVPADFDVEEWKRRVAADPSVYGIVIGHEFEWASVVRVLPLHYEDAIEFRRTVEFLEERTIPGWEWFFKRDIFPAQPNLFAGGAMIGRGIIDQTVNVDNLSLATIGMLLAFPVFVVALGSARHALVGVVSVVLLGLLWCRGTIGIADWLGFGFRERALALLAYTNCIVQGVSFVLHKFGAWLERAEFDETPEERWRATYPTDALIGATAVIAVFGFATLYSFQVLAVRELGLLSALAVLYQFFLAVLVIPAGHLVFGGRRDDRTIATPPRGSVTYGRAIDGVVRLCATVLMRPAARTAATIAATIAGGLVVVATLCIWPGGLLQVKTDPVHFIHDTMVGRGADYLNVPGRPGYEFIETLIQPRQGDLYDPAFLATVAAFQREVESLPVVRESSSIVDHVQQVSRESFGHPLPATRQEARAAFSLIETNLAPVLARQSFYADGVRMTAFYYSHDSNEARVVNESLRAAAARFPQLAVWTFGKFSLYPETDRYITTGKPLNLLSSQLAVVVFCWLGVWWRTRSAVRDGRAHLPALTAGLLMSVPFLVATAIMVLLMVGFGVPLDFATAGISALAINASLDFTIYFADGYQEALAAGGSHAAAVRGALQGKGRLVVQDLLLNSVCFLPLMASRFPPVRDIGWIMVAMLLACALGTLLIMPALFAPIVVAALAPLERATAVVAAAPEFAPEEECHP